MEQPEEGDYEVHYQILWFFATQLTNSMHTLVTVTNCHEVLIVSKIEQTGGTPSTTWQVVILKKGPVKLAPKSRVQKKM